MNSISDLERLLDGLQREGELLSSGQFSVDFGRALEKLGAMAREYVHRWVFYAVQAAVGFQAVRLNLAVNVQSVSLVFTLPCLPDRLRDGRALQGIEESPALGGEEAATYCLRQALLWARALEPTSFALMCTGPHPGYVLTLSRDGTQWKELGSESSSETTISLLLTKPGLLAERWARSLQSEATYRLSFCPVPTSLDGLELSRGDSSYLLRNRDRRQGNVKLFERYVLCGPGHASTLAVLHPRLQPAIRYEAAGLTPICRERSSLPAPVCYSLEMAGEGLQAASWSVQRETGPGLCVGRWSLPSGVVEELRLQSPIAYELPNASGDWARVRVRALFTRMRVSAAYLVCARHGLLLDPIPLPGLPAEGWVVVVACNSVSTDASGLKPVQDDTLFRLERWARAEIYAIHERMGG